MATANEILMDASVRHQIGLQRLSTATVRKILALLARVEEDIVSRMLRTSDGTVSQLRLQKMLEAIREINAEGYAKIRSETTTELRALASYEADYQAESIARAIPIQLDIVKPSASQLYAAVNARPFQGRFLRDWYRQLEEGAQSRLRGAIQMGWVEGETIGQMVRRVRGTRAAQYKDGVLEMSRRGAEGMVRTAVNHTATVARNETYRANSDVIKGVRWVATLDGRTTLVCASRDGTVYDVDKGPRPPAHFNCRSTTSPVIKSWKEMGINLREAPDGTRASMDGQVPAKTTYNEFLRRQPKSFQEEVLGTTKARLFRDGKLPLDKFVDRQGVEYTLDELRRREAAAFERAGL
jgi:SPP1 gp7 family putative phage head morphogenesis protein